MRSICRTYLITTVEGKKIALGAISAKQAERFILIMCPSTKVALIEEIKPLPEDWEP